MNIKEYIEALQRQYATGKAREHSYRPALENLLSSMLPGFVVTNEPARVACGAPDYIITKDGMPVAFAEAKDLDDTDLAGRKQNKEQFDRYKRSLDTIVFTDYLDFHLYEKGDLIDSVRIAQLRGDKISLLKENTNKFTLLIGRLANARPQAITTPAQLAETMAAKARLLAGVIVNALGENEDNHNDNHNDNRDLMGQMEAFRQVLIHDITPRAFADIYAQTIAYGMFAARLHDKSPDTFSRMEAATLIPQTNPFLRKIFQRIAAFDLDERIAWIVDDLAEIFRVTDMRAVMKNFGKRTRQEDPMIHFYEDFLKEYDPALRKSRGVWYTPQPVVNFIVRAVDEILQTQFNLPMGLAETSKVVLERSIEQSKDKRYADNRKKEKREYHKVQILDPATGTGTFLAEMVERIYDRFRTQGGMWQSYVEQHLLPRLNGFELLMASYTIAHLKLDMVLEQTGYKHVAKGERLRVYLTNSLEEEHADTGSLFAQWWADEANEANRIKRDTPVMVVLGNPPYSGESNNKGAWITSLMDDYKKEPGGKEKLKERNPKAINDDYCKFMRLGQYFVDKNKEGVLAYINNHSFLDNITFRGMRWHLLNSFDRIYIVDLHGNSKKKETAPDGGKDENVFDIQQGVSINLFVKTGTKPKGQLAEVYHYDLYGKREEKYSTLSDNGLQSLPFTKLTPAAPEYFFVPKDYSSDKEYKAGFSVAELFTVNSVGVVTSNDKTLINTNKNQLLKDVSSFYNCDAKKELIQAVNYRPFDKQFVYYDIEKLERTREKIMQHFLLGDNVGLITNRQIKTKHIGHTFITKKITDYHVLETANACANVFPLYLYPTEKKDLFTAQHTSRVPNLEMDIVSKIAQGMGLRFVPELSDEADTFAPIHLLDYIYAVLHSPTYRERYREFLKTNFPRVPYPTPAERFWQLAAAGAELRALHLLEHPALNKPIATYPVAGSNEVDKPRYEAHNNETGRVWINDTQYFDGVPCVAWKFYIGGYQPAQKWLKDRKGRVLQYDDISHYQRMITALHRTAEIIEKLLIIN